MGTHDLKAMTIGGDIPGIGEFEHHIAVPAHATAFDVIARYQDKRFRDSCPRFDSLEDAQKAVNDWNNSTENGGDHD